MRKVRTEDAVGLTLCHDITAVRDGFKGRAFQRGHIVTEEDIPALLDLGKRNLYIWEENAGEIHEEEAALRLAAMAPVPGAEYSTPSEGKIGLTARRSGLFRVNLPLLHQINSIGDITIATLPDHYPVEPGMKLVGLRIVPLVTQESQILQAEKLCRESKHPLFELLPYRDDLSCGVIITGSEVYSGRIKDRFEPVIREKVRPFDITVRGVTFCDDYLEMLIEAIKGYRDCDLIIMTGGMSVDPDDLTPTSIRQSGAEIVTQGVPAQPGNMFTVAYLGKTTILGVPGAAIHARITVLDVVLPQAATGLRFTKEDFIRFEDGGLCQLCKDCHWPNCTFGRY